MLEIWSNTLPTDLAIGVVASKFLGVQRIFAQIFPNLPKKLSCNFYQPFLWRDLQKMVFSCLSANLGRQFSKSDNVGCHFCPDFQGFCPDFQQIKTFGGALAPAAPPPPAPLDLAPIVTPYKKRTNRCAVNISSFLSSLFTNNCHTYLFGFAFTTPDLPLRFRSAINRITDSELSKRLEDLTSVARFLVKNTSRKILGLAFCRHA